MLNTYDQQISLMNRSLAIMKNDGKYSTFKYARKAMYDYLWHSIPELMECRGHVYDNETKQLVQAAPRKTFNYLERGWWKEKRLDTNVVAFKKINGFMACATFHNGEIVVSTTGTTTSDYAKYAKKLIEENMYRLQLLDDFSTLFEIVADHDPHIVKEEDGLHLLGYRHKASGEFHPYGDVIYGTLSEIINIAKIDRGEGFMVYPVGNFDECCKIKTPYYIGKKKLMRMNAGLVDLMYSNPTSFAQQLPDIWKFAVEAIKEYHTKEVWLAASDQQRRKFLEYIY